ncbi:MAG: hypothetical protein ACJAXR_001976 [Halopseudomonas sp.]|jgi:hypothetical protein|uniref:DUF4136 domain-containing protein n=1 Tax=Halopseudomonas sp. TaxID=2901191 RepID=UPI0039E31FB0
MLPLRLSDVQTNTCVIAPVRSGVLIVVFALLLVACQTAPVERDYDTSRDFTQYRTWSWAEQAITYTPAEDPRVRSDLTSQRIRNAVGDQLDVRGLRPAREDLSANLRVQVNVISEEKEDQVTTSFGGSIGYWGWGWGGGPSYTQSRSVDYQMLTLQVDLRDASDGQLVWRGSDDQQLWDASQPPAERALQIREMITRILSGYPPP